MLLNGATMIRIQLQPTQTFDEAVAVARDALQRSRAGEAIECDGTDLQTLAFRLLIARGEMLPSEIELSAPDGRAIPLDDRGTPAWWPKDLFTDSHVAFLAIRRALSGRAQ